MTNYRREVVYTGITNDLTRRILEHWQKRGDPSTFAGKYYCYNLVYFEEFQYADKAIAREKEIKGWKRQKKVELINRGNPEWSFLNWKFFDRWPPNGK